ncbi:MAG: glycosyltransferase family 4 protein [Chloroflexi bacterium]|nr:glycosyltransferase family 4 protein [Chloroflexota bacterium]
MTRPLNFLHLTTFYPPYSFGGDAMYIYRLSHLLGDAGHQVDVVHCVDAYHLQHPAEPEISFTEHPNVTRHELRSPYKWLSPLLTQQTGRPYLKRHTLETLLNSKTYDVIQYHNISLLGPQILTLIPRNKQFIKLYMTHEHWLICPTHVLWKFNERACEKPECLRCTLAAKKPPQLWRYTGYLKQTSRHIDRFISPSRFTADMHAKRGFSQPVTHLPYFIERADEDWQKPGQRPQENPYFLFVGRLEDIKGLQTLIPVWGKVEGYDLLVAGTGKYENELRTQAAANPRIKFLGPLPQHELGALYHHALATIVPSITYETFGIIIVESFARKTPVIVRDLGALPEVVEDSDGGYVYRTDTELLEAIQKIASSPTQRTQLGENGYRTFLEQWSPEAHKQIYFHKLQEIGIQKFNTVPWANEVAPQSVK